MFRININDMLIAYRVYRLHHWSQAKLRKREREKEIKYDLHVSGARLTRIDVTSREQYGEQDL